MFRYVSDCRVILFVLGLLPSVIVNLSTNYNHRSEPTGDDDHPIVPDSGRILPGADEYQLQSPLLLDRDLEQDVEGHQSANSGKDRRRYQLVGVSQYQPRFNGSENFVTKTNANQSNIEPDGVGGGDRGWIKKMLGKGLKKRKIADHDLLPKKLLVGYEAKDQLSVDEGHRGNVRRPNQDNNDDLRSGYYFDSYGDWHHSGGGDHGGNGGSGTWINGLTGAGSGYFGGLGHNQHGGGVTNGHSYGSGHHLAGWHLLNPLILVATLSFVISLINAVLGVVDRLKLPIVRARGDAPQYSRVINEEVLNELGMLYDSVHKGKRYI